MKRLKPVPASREVLEKIEQRHGIDFQEVKELFQRSHIVLRGPVDQYGERRFTSLGVTSSGRYLFVVYTIPKPSIAKVITARNMMDREKSFYRRRAGGRKSP